MGRADMVLDWLVCLGGSRYFRVERQVSCVIYIARHCPGLASLLRWTQMNSALEFSFPF